MPIVTLPDNTLKTYVHPVSVLNVAEEIGRRLAEAALCSRVNGRLVDLDYRITEDASLVIITDKDKEGVEVLRHSTAHLLAQAVKHLFPTAQVTIGPVIEDGFYYDFAFERAFTPEDLLAIEKEMHALAKQNIPIVRRELPREEAIQFFQKQGEKYKCEIIEGLSDRLVSLYHQGDFTDLCRGPHVRATGKLKVFKLIKVAGAYWRGDPKNAMLQRIYGTAWAKEDDLKAYLFRLEEAEKRDHRKIGKRLHLFHFQEEAPGMVFWHDKGWTLYQQIVGAIREFLKAHHYQEVHTPLILDKSLWVKSGHWEKFRAEMFTTTSEEHAFAIKPMNCPCHIQIFNQGVRSYRDLPIRLAEFGSCHRNEPSGALHGLMRVREFTQDDAHIFCTEEQIQTEVSAFIDLVFLVYKRFGFCDVGLKLSTRPLSRVGSDDLWDKAEQALQVALEHKGLTWQLAPGEGAFYGPKIDFSLKDSLGRVWQCGTLQVDFSMPERLGAKYIAEDNSRQRPVMLHRAICGSLERFIGVLLEHTAGHLPLWLSPIQMVVSTITDNQIEYAKKVVAQLKTRGIRVVADLRNEKIGYKIREHTLQCIPFLGVVGDKEVQTGTISVRLQNAENWGPISVAEFTHRFDLAMTNFKMEE